MNKNEFLNFFYEEDKSHILKVYDKITLAEKSGACIFSTEFYSPNIWSKLQELSINIGISFESFGGFIDSERRLIAFFSSELDSFPIKMIKIINKSKFSRLEHKDYLGAMMSLGVKREKLGDLVVKENSCYAAVCEDIYDYVKASLTQIGKSPCDIEEISDLDNIPAPEFKNEIIIATSYRLDCIASAITGLSRTKCLSLISSGKVLVNYVVESQKDRIIFNNYTVTIRGYGKYRILDTVGNSGSGRLKINVNKYI
jgi:RNA-binding protein YlmH